MSDIAIQIDGLGKRYRIGAAAQRHDSLRDTLASLVKAPLRNLTQLRRLVSFGEDEQQDVVWALRDVGLEVKHGEVLGIIGRNGAGKSTLLKVLSRITEPTTGRVVVNGRVGALLEVGTGFHQELTGRENVYLNGSILGMDRAYIDQKFDEIVEFAGVQKFIDTPVKRYSSGMYLRLAFAVAAHLEPEVLIVDEVLAVGDTEFQEKCLGKMGEVAREGRTVLLVSHNLHAVSRLTKRSVLLANGRCRFDGPTAEALKVYNELLVPDAGTVRRYEAPAETAGTHLMLAQVHTSDGNGLHQWGHPITFEFVVRVADPQPLLLSFQIMDELQQPLCLFRIYDSEGASRGRPGILRFRCEIPKLRLYMGSYTVTAWLFEGAGITTLQSIPGICPFEVTMQGYHRDGLPWQPGESLYLEDGVWAPIQSEVLSWA